MVDFEKTIILSSSLVAKRGSATLGVFVELALLLSAFCENPQVPLFFRSQWEAAAVLKRDGEG